MSRNYSKDEMRLHWLWVEHGPDGRPTNFRGAVVTYAIHRDANLMDADVYSAIYTSTDLTSAVVTDADLTSAVLTSADLCAADDLPSAVLCGAELRCAKLRATDLYGTDLRGAVLTDAVLTSEVPVVLNLDASILRAIEAPGCDLDMSRWHVCETIHCCAGWAIILAGAVGKRLEEEVGPCAAGALIYHASTGRVPNFYDDEENIMAYLRHWASVKYVHSTNLLGR